jgi:hypothetical protein
MYHFTQDASLWHKNAYTSKSLPMLILTFDSISLALPPFPGASLLFCLLLLSYHHYFYTRFLFVNFRFILMRETFHSDSPHYFYCYFSV